jgi:hypothetical protein
MSRCASLSSLQENLGFLEPRIGRKAAAGPAEGETILITNCSMEEIHKAKAFCDVAGHYARPDVFRLHVNKEQRQQVVDMKDSDCESDGSGDPEEV